MNYSEKIGEDERYSGFQKGYDLVFERIIGMQKVLRREEQKLYNRKLLVLDFSHACFHLWFLLKKILARKGTYKQLPLAIIQESIKYNLIEDQDLWYNILCDSLKKESIYPVEETPLRQRISFYIPILRQTIDHLKYCDPKNE